jgi:DNA-binding MarR family transcriptional regulator
LHGRVLLYIYRHPGRPAAEIAAGLKLNPGTIWPVIGDLRSRGMITVERRRRRHYYFANGQARLTHPAVESMPVDRLFGGLTRRS